MLWEGCTVCKGVLRDTWVTTVQKSTSIFHHTGLFGVPECEVKHRAFCHQVSFVSSSLN